MVYANWSKEYVIYPLTGKEIATPKDKTVLSILYKHDKNSIQLVEDTELLCKDGKMVTTTVLQNQTVSWYHHYLQCPGHTCPEDAVMY